MNPLAQFRGFLTSRQGEMLALLKELVLLQSHSRNKAGVDRVGASIRSVLRTDPVGCEIIEQSTYGNHLRVQSSAVDRYSKQVLMVGHMDTVFPEDSPFNWYREDNTYCYGPGVADMKGGLVAGIYALKALGEAGLLEKIPVTFFFNSDEEIGSPSSRKHIRAAARRSLFAFVFEAGGLQGEIVTGRKGNLSLALTLSGKSGHAAFAGKHKASAVLELAHKIIAIEALNDEERGISANVGQISGGIGPNTVPASAAARIDLRFKNRTDQNFVTANMQAIAAKVRTPNTQCNLEIVSARPPMPSNRPNRRLFRTVAAVAAKLGLSVAEEYRQGVSDANLIAAEDIPVLDGLGPIGAKDHSEEEYMQKSSLPERSLLAAGAIWRCWEEFARGA
jgi:glutamate carboxypeptidase